jgi:hypothetical protein
MAIGCDSYVTTDECGGYVTIGEMRLETNQHFCARVGLEANSVRALIQNRVIASIPYYQEYDEGPIWIEDRCADAIIEAANAAQTEGLSRPDTRELSRVKRPRNSKKFMEFVRIYLETNKDLWTPEQKALKPPMERRGKRNEPFHPPLPWPGPPAIVSTPEPESDLLTGIDEFSPARMLTQADHEDAAKQTIKGLLMDAGFIDSIARHVNEAVNAKYNEILLSIATQLAQLAGNH